MRTAILSLVAIASVAAGARSQHSTLVPESDATIKAAVENVSAKRIEATVRALAGFGTRNTFSDTASDTRGIGAARRWIKERFDGIVAASEGRMSAAFEEYPVGGPRVPEGTKVTNVVARLTGSDSQRYVIVSGHYDSIPSRRSDGDSDAPGANDDASGVAVMMEAARVMSGLEPRANVLFVAYDGEEHGLWGSKAHAARARSERWRVSAMITNDIVGGVVGSAGQRDPYRLRIFSEGVPSGPVTQRGRPRRTIVGSDNDAPSRQLARYVRRRAQRYVPHVDVLLIFRQDRYMRGGDHRPFNREGFAAVRATEPFENYSWQHQDVRVDENGKKFGDLPDNLDYAYVRRVAQVNIATLCELALAPAEPRQVRMIVARLTPHTELRWQASPEKDLAGYGILYRRTHEPFWTHRRTVGKDETSVVFEGFSKDDWLFAVEAIDAKGRRSLPVYPRPSRR